MKRLISAAMLLSMGMFVIGCSASADVDPNHDHGTASDSSGTYEKKTVTVEHPNGSSEKTVETHTSN
jgi:hypothetical protein